MEAGIPQEGEREGKGSPIPKIRKWKTEDYGCVITYIHQPYSLVNTAKVPDH